MFEVKLKGLANSGGQRPGSKVQCRSLWRVDSQVPTVTRDFDFMISVFHMKPLKSAYSQVGITFEKINCETNLSKRRGLSSTWFENNKVKL